MLYFILYYLNLLFANIFVLNPIINHMEFKHKIKLFLNDPAFKRRTFYIISRKNWSCKII